VDSRLITCSLVLGCRSWLSDGSLQGNFSCMTLYDTFVILDAREGSYH